MSRRFVILGLAFVMFVVFSSSVVFGLYESTHPWSMWRYDLVHSGFTSSTAPNSNATLWESKAFYPSCTLIVVDGKVIVTGTGPRMYALDETTGVELWRSFSFSGSPRGNVAYDNGRVYIGTSNGYVYCINAENGAKIWEKQFTGDQITTNPVVYNGKVYIGTYNGYIYALDATTGLSIPGWYYSTSNNPINSNPAVYNDIFYFGCDDDKIHAINISSDAGPMLLWQFTTSGDVRSSPCIGDGKVFIGTSSVDRAILALNATTTQPSGELIWKYVLATGYTIDTTPAYVDGTLYFAIGTKAYALNANVLPGTYPEGSITIEKWTVTVGNYPTSLTVADGKVFLSNGYETLLCLNATTGITLWTYKFTTYNSEEPVIADGRLFVTQHFGVFCFGESYPELTYYYTVTPVGVPFVIKLVEQNATPSSTISIDQLTTEKKINFTITGIENSYSTFNITIPNEMLGGPYYVKIDGALRSHTPTDNGTHTSLYFNYYHTDKNPHNVEITGTTAIPEFSSIMILLLLLILSLIALVLAKTKQSRN